MKSLVYILITVFIGSILFAALPITGSKQKQVVELLSIIKNPDSRLIDESSLIIRKRLVDYGVKDFDMSTYHEQGIIQFTFNEKTDVSDILPLLISKGDIAFYETAGNTGNPFLGKSHILEVAVNKVNQSNELLITFNKEGAIVWQDISKNNINKSIALMLDGQVYFAPVLMSEITNGKCTISGNFTLSELTKLKSLITNENLPLDFTVK